MILDLAFKKDYSKYLSGAVSRFLSEEGVLESEGKILSAFLSSGEKLGPASMGKLGKAAMNEASFSWYQHITKRAEFFSGLDMQSFGESALKEAEGLGGFFSSKGWAKSFPNKFTGHPRNVKGYDRLNYSLAMLERTADTLSGTGSYVKNPIAGVLSGDISQGMSSRLSGEYAGRFFGQSKVLREVTKEGLGGVVPFGSTDILGRITKPSQAIQNFGMANEVQAIRILRNEMLGRTNDLYSFFEASGARQRFESLNGEILFNTSKRFSAKAYLASLSQEQQSTLRDLIERSQAAAMQYAGDERVIRKTTSGYNKVKSLIEESPVGREFFLRGGKRAVVEELKSVGDISVLTAEGESLKYATYAENLASANKLVGKTRSSPIRVNLMREPWVGSATHPADKFAVKVVTPDGIRLGNIAREFSSTFGKGIESGAIPGDWFARIHKDVMNGKARYYVSIASGAAENNLNYALINKRYRLAGVIGTAESPIPVDQAVKQAFNVETHQQLLETFFSKNAQMLGPQDAAAGVSEAVEDAASRAANSAHKAAKASAKSSRTVGDAFASAQTTKRMPGGSGAASAEASSAISGARLASGSKMQYRGLIAAAAIAAGALVLWGASRASSRNKPITAADVPTSLYGAVTGKGQAMNGVPAPYNRVVQNNDGYATNVDVYASDSRGVTDYRPMVNNLSSMANSSMGVSASRSSLHVVDDSYRMDKESVRRQMNSMLG